MRFIRTFAVTVPFLVPVLANAATESCAPDITIPLLREQTGHVSTTLFVNGRPARFLVDTGANVSTLDTAASTRLNAVVSPREGMPPGEGSTSLPVTAASVSLGSQPFAVMNLEFINIPSKRYGTEPFAGQLGSAFFEAFAARIDYKGMLLCLRARNASSAN